MVYKGVVMFDNIDIVLGIPGVLIGLFFIWYVKKRG